MLFNSLTFLIFFALIIVGYFSIPHRYRFALLLIGSYYFYMSTKVVHGLLLATSTLISYVSALQIGTLKTQRARRAWLIGSLCLNFGLLFIFKYVNFLTETLDTLLKPLALPFAIPRTSILLPIGISFFTFQSVSYVIDVYRKEVKPQRHLGVFALYLAFFPQLVAGPIERASHLLPQFFEHHHFDYPRMIAGLKMMLWGFS